MKVAVIGGGSWATALVKVLGDNQVPLAWWMRDREVMSYIQQHHRNPRYLSDASLQIRRGTLQPDLRKAVAGSDVVILAVPAAFLRDAMKGLNENDLAGKWVLSAVKGMVPGENLLIGQFLQKYFRVSPQHFMVITGPCHAEEVASEKLSFLTLAAEDAALATPLLPLFQNRYLQIKASDDPSGSEYASVMKNIYAIAGGIAHGLGYGDNFMAVLISNAIIELKSFLRAVYPKRRDIKGSAYLGDLLVTAYSRFSRNRYFGTMLGKGYSVRSAQLEMNMVAEGYYSAKAVFELNKLHKCPLPIATMVFRVLYEGVPARTAMQQLQSQLL
ncbi:MAG: NAD(P)H-dependent glycerol-3-phosphate dehydrogenase [Bacteroidia bacterium]